MQGLFENSASYLFVANTAIGSYTTVATMPNGSFAIVNDAGTVQTGAITSSTSTYRVVMKTAQGKVIYSPHFQGTKMSFKDYTAYDGHVEQVSFLGYNGSTGAMDASAGQTFKLRIFLEWTKSVLNNSALILEVPFYTTDATQRTLVDGLFDGVVALMNRQPYTYLRVNRVSDLASMSAFATANMALVTKGSQTVAVYTKATAATVAISASTTSATATYAVNIPSTNGRKFTFTATANDHAIYIGTKSIYVADAGADTDNATAIAAAINLSTNDINSVAYATVTSSTTVNIFYRDSFYGLPPVVFSNVAASPATVAVTIATGDAVPNTYTVSATTSAAATFLLDKAWTGETGYVYIGTTLASNMGTAAISGISNWGLKLTSVRPSNFVPQTDVPYVGSFSLKFNNLAYTAVSTTASVTDSVTPYDGTGTYRQIANQEAYASFMNKQSMVQAYPSNANLTQAVEGQNYDIVDITAYNDNMIVPTLGIQPKSVFNIRIAINNTLTTDVSNVQTVLAVS